MKKANSAMDYTEQELEPLDYKYLHTYACMLLHEIKRSEKICISISGVRGYRLLSLLFIIFLFQLSFNECY